MDPVLRNVIINGQEKASRAVQLQSLPNIVGLPTGTTCNYQCVFCKGVTSAPGFERRDVSFEQFKQLASVVKDARNIGLFSWGEPLYNRDYSKMFSHVATNHPNSFISLSTNGSLMNDRMIGMFVDQGLVCVNVSINAPNESLYRKITGSTLFQKVKRNVARLNSVARTRLFARIKVILSLVLIPDVIEVLPSFVDLAVETGSTEILIQNYMDFGAFQEDLSIQPGSLLCQSANDKYQETKTKAYSAGINLRVFAPVPFLRESFPYECWEPWERFWINLNGSVHVCCYSKQVMGNVLENDVNAIWNNTLYQHYRATVNTACPPESCRECPRRRWWHGADASHIQCKSSEAI